MFEYTFNMKAVCFYLHCLLTYSINISKVYIFPEHLSMYSVYIIAVSVYLFYSIDCISVYSKHAMYTLHRYLVSMLLKFSCIIYCVQVPTISNIFTVQYCMYIYILSLCACAVHLVYWQRSQLTALAGTGHRERKSKRTR